MKQELVFSGLSSLQSDFESRDGDLALALNLIPEEGTSKSLCLPKPLCSLPKGLNMLFFHTTPNFSHLIFLLERDISTTPPTPPALLWIEADEVLNPQSAIVNDFHPILSPLTFEILSVNAIGNTLVVLGDDAVHYFLFKDDAYINLGSHLPELPISFGLQASEPISDEYFTFTSTGNWTEGNTKYELTNLADDQNNKVLAKVNKFISDAHKDGKFVLPFFVRYAYRLYDGSLTMHSCPVLMVTASYENPFIEIIGDPHDSTVIYCNLFGATFQLDYECINSADITALSLWSDIVKSVDIFVSAPIYSYDQNGKIDSAQYRDMDTNFTICHTPDVNELLPPGCEDCYARFPFSFVARGALQNPLLLLNLPRHSDQYVNSQYSSCSNFYLLNSIKLEDLASSRTIIDVPDGLLPSLQTREAMTDDYDSHDSLMAKCSYSYNSRLLLGNITKTFAPLPPLQALVPFVDKAFYASNGNIEPLDLSEYQLYLHFRSEGKSFVAASSAANLDFWFPFFFLYTPFSQAYRAVVRQTRVGSSSRYFSLPMLNHDFLNGSYYYTEDFFKHFELLPDTQPSAPTASTNFSVSLSNRVYSSEINNPFFFPASGIISVGNNSVIGISSSAKALSQGQFGQFPLYVFADDGIWAISVSQTGLFTAVQPISRDVCNNTNSITQIDSAVLFTSDRGIMLASGSDTFCISEPLDNLSFSIINKLPYYDQLFQLASLPEPYINSFADFSKNCQLLYDYTNQRIIAYQPRLDDSKNPVFTYAFVYSLISKKWGMMVSNIKSGTNSYPDAIATTFDNSVVSLSYTEDSNSCILFTRPLKFGDPLLNKTIRNIVATGFFNKKSVAITLYGSRDLETWRLIASSSDNRLLNLRGSGYKFFIVALNASLAKNKSLYGLSVALEPRQTNHRY